MPLCLDMGASNIRAAIVSGRKITDKRTIKTPKHKDQIISSIIELIQSYPEQKFIGISIAGFTKDGVVQSNPNLPDFNNVNIKKIIKAKFKTKVEVDNDANCAGLAELYYGYKKKNFVLLTLGTGVGGAIIIDGKLIHGKGYAGEPGSMIYNNKRWETLASGSAAKLIAKKHGLDLNSYKLSDLAKKGNKKALSAFDELGQNIAWGILNISYILDPEIIVLGGGFSSVPFYYKSINKYLKDKDDIKRNIIVKKSKLGDDAGLIGAAILQRLK